MQTTARQVVTIVAEAVLEHRLVKDIKSCGAKGYSLTHVRGEGVTGYGAQDLNGPSVRLETVVTQSVAESILTMLNSDYLNRYAVVAWTTDVQVLRPQRF